MPGPVTQSSLKESTYKSKSSVLLGISFGLALGVLGAPAIGQRAKPAPDVQGSPRGKSAPVKQTGPGDKTIPVDIAPGEKSPDQKQTPEGSPGLGGGRRRGGGGEAGSAPDTKAETAYDFHLIGSDGKDVPVSDYKGKYLLLVNLGRKSSYNDQLAALIKVNDTYKSKGLVVIGIPSNEFGGAEPGTQAEILKAYADAKVDFPIMGISKLTGDDALPLYGFLTKGTGGTIAWNYTKFIVDKKGNAVAWLDSDVTPDSPEMLSTIDEILDGTYKPKKEPAGGARAGAGLKAAN